MRKTNLYRDFSPLSTREWNDIIKAELGDEKAIELLSWHSPEGITVKPFFHFDTHRPLPYQYPNPKWDIAERMAAEEFSDPKFLANLNGSGIDRLIINTNTANNDPDNYFTTLAKTRMPLHLESAEFNVQTLIELSQQLSPTNEIHLQSDIIGQLAATGNWKKDEQADWYALGELLLNSASATTLSVNAGLYQNAGANRIQQLAYAVAHGIEYLNFINANSLSSVKSKIVFQISIGANYFFEIAKVRALRWVWKSICKTYDLPGDCIILAEPTSRNKTFLDYNVNMVRTTTECMSAILGGADSVCNQPYNHVFQAKEEFGARIARNQLLILKHESYFNIVTNPAEGSYFVDFLTHKLAKEALDLVKIIEKDGGFIESLKSGKIQNAINKSAQEELLEYEKGSRELIGVTNVGGEWEIPPAIDKELVKPTQIVQPAEIEPIIPHRLAIQEEQKALKNG